VIVHARSTPIRLVDGSVPQVVEQQDVASIDVRRIPGVGLRQSGTDARTEARVP
jgi:hypothetical protein